jgi:CBS domain containing-hemolysin-like protein
LEADALYKLATIGLCLIASALFSSTETALTSLSHRRIHQLFDSGRKSALLSLWLKKPNDVLTTVLIANNIVNILAASLATAFSQQQLLRMGFGDRESLAVAITVGVMTLIILVFGEVVPKTYAKHNPNQLIPFFPVTFTLYYLFLPLTRVLVFISGGVVWLSGGKFEHQGPLVTEEDLEWMILRGHKENVLHKEISSMLTGALDLEDTVAREIMMPRTKMVMFEVNETLEEIWEEHREHNYSRYPVYDEVPDKVIGIFYIKDLLYFLIDPAGKKFSLRELMRTDLFFVPESKNVREILTELKTKQIGMGIVVDEFGGVSGMVALEDILEEMVGEIYDEYDKPAHQFIEEKPGCYRIQAQYLLADLEEHLHVKTGLPLDRGYDTVGGLLMDLAGRVPLQGEVLTWPKNAGEPGNDSDETIAPQLSFTILAATETTVDTVRMEILQPLKNTTEENSEPPA